MKNKKYHTVGTVSKAKRKTVDIYILYIYIYIYTLGHKLGTTSFSLQLKYFSQMCEKNLQLRTTIPFMDEHNITQSTKRDQVFFSKISNRKYYSSLK
jgi:hypothetical protein